MRRSTETSAHKTGSNPTPATPSSFSRLHPTLLNETQRPKEWLLTAIRLSVDSPMGIFTLEMSMLDGDTGSDRGRGMHMDLLPGVSVMPSLSWSLRPGSRYAQRLHRRRYRIGEEHGVNPLYDFLGDFEKIPFVFQWDQCLACSFCSGERKCVQYLRDGTLNTHSWITVWIS